jgi:oligoendopeptidase F
MNASVYSKEAVRAKRRFVPESLVVDTWPELENLFHSLLERKPTTSEEFDHWLTDISELECVLSEDVAWRYIRMTCDTSNKAYREAFDHYLQNIQPHLAKVSDALNKSIAASAFAQEPKDEAQRIFLRKLRADISLFREENIALHTEMAKLQRNYGEIQGAMTIEHEEQVLTMPQAADLLQSHDRGVREAIFYKMVNRRLQDSATLNELLSQLIALRHQIAQNAGLPSFAEYKFIALGRFDYTKDDCHTFHHAVKEHVVPMLNMLAESRSVNLRVDHLRPWDTVVDFLGTSILRPFTDAADLFEKTKTVFAKVDPFFAECLQVLEDLEQIDLSSRVGKAPGGYNYPLMESGAPFIFMNATSNLRDMVTLLHEGGHAVHSLLTKDLSLAAYKELPSEIAELASMGMELLTMDYWDTYFSDVQELNRAKYRHLEQIIQTLPWVATIDKFQHWMYEHPFHTETERKLVWSAIFEEFTDSVVDYSGLEHYKYELWQKQLHIYEVPFYYIEYGIAQLGAVALWKNYRKDPVETLSAFKHALSLGNTRTLPELYKAAGIRFNMSGEYIAELMHFVYKEMLSLDVQMPVKKL